MADENRAKESTPIQMQFDYTVLEESKRVHVQIKTEAIKGRMKRAAEDIIAIGQDLIEVKEELGHGLFQKWLKAEFDLSESAATKFMQVATRFGDEIKSVKITGFPLTVLYTLAAPSTPEEIVERVLSGEIPADAKSIKEAKEAQQKAETALAQERQKRLSIETAVTNLHYEQEDLYKQFKKITEERDHLRRELDGGLQAYYEKNLQMKAENTFLALLTHAMQKLAEAQQVVDHMVSPGMIGEVRRLGEGHQFSYRALLAQLEATYRSLYEAEIKLTGPFKNRGEIVDEDTQPRPEQ
ncbi:MAG TPA: DUF3102 domain-containing protein [Ktedonobacteraceae bacterium]|nr:DUF3102 domain-containing protein [Ktedonobacteraceae bacterium]